MSCLVFHPPKGLGKQPQPSVSLLSLTVLSVAWQGHALSYCHFKVLQILHLALSEVSQLLLGGKGFLLIIKKGHVSSPGVDLNEQGIVLNCVIGSEGCSQTSPAGSGRAT